MDAKAESNMLVDADLQLVLQPGQRTVWDVVVVVVVFFTLTDRASTIPSNTRGCQSGTWSAGHKKIRGTSTKLQ